MCPAKMDSLNTIGKIVGIVIGSTVALAFLICISVIIYMIFCKRKPRTQVWAYPSPRPQSYGQRMCIFPYANYPGVPLSLPLTDPHRIIEEPPPAYEEINTIEHSTKK
jgi:hypothetical protein